MEELEQKTKELLWEGIAALNQQIKEEKAEREKPLKVFNRLFQKKLKIFKKGKKNGSKSRLS